MSPNSNNAGLFVAKVVVVLAAGFGLGAGVPMLLIGPGGNSAPTSGSPRPRLERPAPPVPELTVPIEVTDPAPAEPAATPEPRAESVTEQAIDAWLDGDADAALDHARIALGLVGEMSDASRSAVLRVRLGKIVALARATRETARNTEDPGRAAVAGTDVPDETPADVETPSTEPPRIEPAPRTTSRLSGALALSLDDGAERVRLTGVDVAVLRCRLDAALAAPLHEQIQGIVDAEYEALAAAVDVVTAAGSAPASAVRALRQLRAEMTRLTTDHLSVDVLFSALMAARGSMAERVALGSTLGTDPARARKEVDALVSTLLVQARILETTTDEDGAYAFGELAPGTYLVHAASAGERWHAEWLGVFDASRPADYRFDLSNENARWLRVDG